MKLMKIASNSIVIIGLVLVYMKYERIRSQNRFYNENNSSEILQICPRKKIQKKYVKIYFSTRSASIM